MNKLTKHAVRGYRIFDVKEVAELIDYSYKDKEKRYRNIYQMTKNIPEEIVIIEGVKYVSELGLMTLVFNPKANVSREVKIYVLNLLKGSVYDV